jgi:hypothetical protein
MKKIVAVAFVASVLSIGSSASATQTDYFVEGVTSGSYSFEPVADAICVHTAGSIVAFQSSSSPTATGYYRIENLNTYATSAAYAVKDGYQITFSVIVAGTHQLQVRRYYPADTNGIGFGSGVTTFYGYYTCPNF